jgi:urease accessory protein
LAPTAAQAHLVATGMGPIYDGISHFGLSPEDFLPVIALAFWAGLRGSRSARLLLWTLPSAWLAGGLLAMAGLALPVVVLPAATSALFLAIGGLLASNAPLRPIAGALAGIALGLVRGAADLTGVSASGPHFLTLLGMCACTFATFAVATSLTLPLQRLWLIVAARVSGSWLAAIGLLLAGWIMRYGALVR